MKCLSKLVLILCIVVAQYSYGQSTVYVKTNQFGRGILKMRGAETYVITPEHLLKQYYGPITVIGEGSERARAELLKTYIGDLAVLRFPEEHNLYCNKWQLDKNYSSIIENIFEAFIELREEDGSATKVAVDISGLDVQYIFIRPNDYREKFYQGMSGSSLFVDYQGKKVFLGMLQSISDDENGLVIRADELDKILGSFFNPVKKGKRSNVITDKELVREVAGIKFELLSINKSADKVTFGFDVTSLNEDKRIVFAGRDNQLIVDGYEYYCNTIIIGNKSSYYVDYNLVKGIPVPLRFVYTGISSSAEFASLLEVKFSINKVISSFNYGELFFGDNTEELDDSGNWSKVELGFEYEMESFRKTGDQAEFIFSVTSLNTDKIVKIGTKDVLLYDDRGFETNADKILIGNKTGNYVDYNLIRDVKVPFILTCKIDAAAKSVSKLEVNFSDGKNKGVFEIRNLTFPEKTVAESQKTESKSNSNSNVSEIITDCSEIYFYRKNSSLESPTSVYLYNHGELLTRLDLGVRYKAIVCDPDRTIKLSVKTNQDEIALSSSKPDIEMGKKYYFKINCVAGISSIKLMDTDKGEKDIENNSKFKRKLVTIPLTDY
jgi:hypothetical protein